MTADLETTALEGLEKIYQARLSREETFESVVPDTMPDIGRILDTDGTLTIRSKAVDNGRIAVGGKITAWVLYVPEGGGNVRTLGAEWEFTVTAEAPEAEPDCPAAVELRLAAIDSRLLNPRKILLRADVRADARCWRKQRRELLCGIKNADELGIQLRPAELCCSRVAAVTEKTFVVTDDCTLPAAAPPIAQFINGRVRAAVDEIKPIGSKQVLRGTVYVTLLYLDSDGELRTYGLSTAFSQLVETDTDCSEPSAEATLTPTGVFFETHPEPGGAVRVETHLLAQVVVLDSGRQRCVTDAYSTRYPLSCERSREALGGAPVRTAVRESLRELVRTETPAVRVLDAAAVAGDVTLSGGTARCPVAARVIYAGADGELRSATARLNVSSDVGIDSDELTLARAVCGEAFAAPAEGGAELRLPVEFTLEAAPDSFAELVSSVTVGDEPLPRRGRPSLTLTRRAEGMSLWDIAKRCGSTEAAIREANSLEDAEPECGAILLAPAVF